MGALAGACLCSARLNTNSRESLYPCARCFSERPALPRLNRGAQKHVWAKLALCACTRHMWELKRLLWLPVCFRAVTESINQLITLCTQQAAGQKECDNALRELEVAVLTFTYNVVHVHVCMFVCMYYCTCTVHFLLTGRHFILAFGHVIGQCELALAALVLLVRQRRFAFWSLHSCALSSTLLIVQQWGECLFLFIFDHFVSFVEWLWASSILPSFDNNQNCLSLENQEEIKQN